MIPVDGAFIYAVAPRFSGAKKQAQARIIGAISNIFSSTLDKYNINSRLRIAHFMAQVTHECAGFRTTEEFASGKKYEGRKDLGNTHSGDGERYKGRGLIQLTGKANYQHIGNILGIPLENEPKLAAEPVTSLLIACEYWRQRGINKAADRDDLIATTKLVNGGGNGLDERRRYLVLAKTELARIQGLIKSSTQDGSSTILHRGSFGEGVIALQELLNAKGSMIAVDGDFGAATELAVMTFQKSNGLEVDGLVGPDTWARLQIQTQ